MNRLWLFLSFILLQAAILFSETDSQSQVYTINTRTSAVSSLIEGSPVVFTLDSSTQVILLKKVGQWGQVARVENQDVNGYVKLKYLSPIETVVSKPHPIEPESDLAKEKTTFASGKLLKPTLKLSLLLAAIVLLVFLLAFALSKSFAQKKLKRKSEVEGRYKNIIPDANYQLINVDNKITTSPPEAPLEPPAILQPDFLPSLQPESSSKEKIESIENILPTFKSLPPDELGRLPQYLDNFLFDVLGAIPRPLRESYHDPENEEYLKIYLGTYFPRSFVETKSIVNELFKTTTIQNAFSSKKELKILDVGSGSGANLLGLLDFLSSIKCLPAKITVISIDGFEMALDYQERIVDLFAHEKKIQIDFIKKVEWFKTRDDFYHTIDAIVKSKKFKFDFIMTSKFIISMYKSSWENFSGTYKLFCQFLESHLSENGLAIAIEMTDCVDITLGYSEGCEYVKSTNFPIIMNEEIKSYINHSASLDILLPLPCSFYFCNSNECFSQKIYRISHSRRANMISKVTFKVFAFKTLAEKFRDEITVKDCYIHNWHNTHQICQRGIITNGITPKTACFDAFSISIEHLKNEIMA